MVHGLHEGELDLGEVFDDLKQMEGRSSHTAEIYLKDNFVGEVAYEGKGFSAVIGRTAVEVSEQDLGHMNELDGQVAKYLNSRIPDVYLV